MLNKQKIQNICLNLNWKEVPTINIKMLSFIRNKIRANIYSSGTLTFQDAQKKYDKGIIYKDLNEEQIDKLMT